MASESTEHIDPFVDDYLHGVLSDAEATQIERHCESCARCQNLITEGRVFQSLLKSPPPTEASEELLLKTKQRIEQTLVGRQRRWQRLVRTVTTLTTAAVLLIGVYHIYFATVRPTPYDLRVLGQQEWLEGSYASVRVAVYDHEHGAPMAGVPVELSLDSDDGPISLANFTTTGQTLRSPRFRVPEGGGHKLIVTAFPNGKREVLSKSVTTKRAWKLMLSTDKPVYQPGQTIHMRAIGLRRPDLEPMAGTKATFSIADPKGNVIFRQADVSTRYGIVSADCPTATEIIEGAYELRCEMGSTMTTRTVTIEKYVLPKFKVTLACTRPFYQPHDEVSGTIQADYFFGEPVREGTVSLQAFTTDVEPVLLHSAKLTTDDMGKSEFRFRLPEKFYGREQTGGDAEFQLFATVTDTAGQAYTTATKRLVTRRPLRVEVIPESGTLVPNVANRIYLFTSTADRQPTAARVAISGLDSEIVTNTQGISSFELTPQQSRESVTVKATAVDDASLVIRKTIQLECGGVGDYLLRPNKAVYAGGETMQLQGFGGGVEPIFVDLLQDGQCVLSETVEMRNGQGELELDLPADLFGTIRMVTYRLNSQGLPYRKARTLFVRQPGGLHIEATMDRDSYRPGESATLTIKLTDAEGKPQPGAVSLAAVDEAVFSVLNQTAGVERVFFLLEKELLKPVYAIYPWVPTSLQNQDEQQHQTDRALLSLTSDVATGTAAVPQRFMGPRSQVQEAGRSSTESSPFTLHAASYQRKLRAVKRWQKTNLRIAEQAWWWLLASLVATVGITFTIYRPKWSLILALACAPVACCILTWFTLSIRAGSPMADAMATMSGIEPMDDAMAWEMDDEMQLESAVLPTLQESPRTAPPRLREYFPETLLWRPELVTDDAGTAQIEIPLADSITTWRLSASAVAAGGQLGSIQKPIKVFQPFFVDLNLPVSLTRHDEVSVPLVVYNYLDEPQMVTLNVADASWFERLLPTTSGGERPPEPQRAARASNHDFSLQLEPGEVRALAFPIRVLQVGRHAFQVTATSPKAADAVRRDIEVVPNGEKVEFVTSGNLDSPANLSLLLPDNVIPGSSQAFVKLYPSTFSQLIEGLDSIFKMPYGCFEQTSSTTYPNVLALHYLRTNQLSQPAIEAKARQFIHLGYQRLLSFEVPGGGFDWYGNPPGKLTLTAYGLMEFQDMAEVHDVDPQLIARTRAWILRQRNSDGSWNVPDRKLATIGRANQGPLATTAYIAWSVFSKSNDDGDATLSWLLRHPAESIDSPYLLALMLHAIHAIDPSNERLQTYADRLLSLCQTDSDKHHVWWEQAPSDATMFYGRGRAGACETTALAALALLQLKTQPATTRGALNWLVTQKDANGTWYSTQATVLALKALTAGSQAPLGGTQARTVNLTWNNESLPTVNIAAEQSEVVQQRELTSHLSTGENHLTLAEPTETGTMYQVIFRYHVPESTSPEPAAPLAIDIAYDRTRLEVDQHVNAIATVTNQSAETAPMVMVDLPIPGGFRAVPDDFVELQGSGKIAKFQITARQVIVYLLELQPQQKLSLNYRLRATMPVDVATPAGQVYEYYDPDNRAQSTTSRLQVTEPTGKPARSEV